MASRTIFPVTTVAAAATTNGTSYSIGNGHALTVESIFLYGAGGTTCKVFVQTSFDGGTTWVDIISHAFTTSAASKVSTVTSYIAPAAQALTPSDGALTDNTIIQGVLGAHIRAKVVSTGTYSGATSIAVYAVFKT